MQNGDHVREIVDKMKDDTLITASNSAGSSPAIGEATNPSSTSVSSESAATSTSTTSKSTASATNNQGIDFTLFLPLELSCKIFSFFSPRQKVRATEVSKIWRSVSETPASWANVYPGIKSRTDYHHALKTPKYYVIFDNKLAETFKDSDILYKFITGVGNVKKTIILQHMEVNLKVKSAVSSPSTTNEPAAEPTTPAVPKRILIEPIRVAAASSIVALGSRGTPIEALSMSLQHDCFVDDLNTLYNSWEEATKACNNYYETYGQKAHGIYRVTGRRLRIPPAFALIIEVHCLEQTVSENPCNILESARKSTNIFKYMPGADLSKLGTLTKITLSPSGEITHLPVKINYPPLESTTQNRFLARHQKI